MKKGTCKPGLMAAVDDDFLELNCEMNNDKQKSWTLAECFIRIRLEN